MEIPEVFDVDKSDNRRYILRLKANVYGQKQAGRVWNKYLVTNLMKIGFFPSDIDECIFYKDGMVYALYTNYYILTGPNHKQLLQTIEHIKGTGLKLTNEGYIQDFLGININWLKNGTLNMCQPHLIQQVLDELNPKKENVKGKTTPMAASLILHRHPKLERFDQRFN